MGMDADPRGKSEIKKLLERRSKEYENLPLSKKEDYDLEDLKNPYTDSRIILGDGDKPVDKALVGIDITSAEVALAELLNNRGEGIDLLIAHHPVGGPLADIHQVMEVQADILAQYGVPINVAEGVMRERISEVQRIFSPRNHNQAADAARLLGFSMMCVHTITDNLVHNFFAELFSREKPDTVGDIIKILKKQPEYQEAIKGKSGPMVFAGSENNRAGKIAPIEFTGGTEASHVIYEKLAIAGVGTVIGMHASEEHRSEAIKHHINLVIAGHMSSDSLGMNLFLDELEKQNVSILPCSGLIRVSRLGK